MAKISFNTFFNATYKINKFKMPLFTNTVVILIKTVTNIIYNFINNKRFERFN